MKKQLHELREDYRRAELLESDAGDDPMPLFERWLADARDAEVPEPNAMTVATVGEDGQPSARIVLLKELDGRIFRFYTNYESQKGGELDKNPRAALVFWWPDCERQVRVEGEVQRSSPEIADRYFASRPHKSRLGAWASRQSQPASGRPELEGSMSSAADEYGEALERPPYWGGYDVIATRVEFWQGRSGRLHDRLVYTAGGDGWRRERLQP